MIAAHGAVGPDQHRLAHPCPGPALGERPAVLLALLDVKAAAAAANAGAGVLEPSTAAAIGSACDRLAAPDAGVRFLAPLWMGGGSVAVNTEVNGRVGAESGVDPRLVNASQSTADVVHTAGRIALARSLPALLTGVRALADDLDRAGRRWSDASATTVALTCLRDALEVPMSTWPAGAAAALRRHGADLEEHARELELVTLGSTVVGTGAGAPVAYRESVVPTLAARTGLAVRAHPDPASALQHGDDVLAVVGSLGRLAARIIRLGGDLRLLGSGPDAGFGVLDLEPVGDGSSFFAGKTNPIDAETAIQLACRAQGHEHAATVLAARGELHLDVFDLPRSVAVLDAAADLAAATASMAAAVAAVRPTPRRAPLVPTPETADVA